MTIVDKNTGCDLITPWEEVSSIHWTGGCTDGKISGEGIISWYNGNKLLWVTTVGKSAGIVLRNGRLAFSIDLRDFKFKIDRCKTWAISRTRHITVTAIKKVSNEFFMNWWTDNRLRDIAAQFFVEACPIKDQLGYDNIELLIKYPGRDDYVVKAKNDEKGELSWHVYENTLRSKRFSFVNRT